MPNDASSQSSDDLYCYSLEHVLRQADNVTLVNGRYTLQFYTDNGRLSPVPTPTRSTFYFYPSAGALRDDRNNIVVYSSKLDVYHKRHFGFEVKK